MICVYVTASDSTHVIDKDYEAAFASMIKTLRKERDRWGKYVASLPRVAFKFEHIMKMRNTDGRPVKYSTWKPPRMLHGRDNIGTKNFKKG